MKVFNNIILVAAFTLTCSAWGSESVLCKSDSSRQLSFANQLQIRQSTEFSMITWNAHKLGDSKFLPDLLHLSRDTDLILIQEAMHNSDLQQTFTNQFEFSFSFNKSFCNNSKEATGVMNASRFILQNNMTIVSPKNEPITSTPKVSGYSVIQIPEIGIVHIINTHALNFNFGSDFNSQINHLAKFIKQLNGPVIWAGDFNTWSQGRQHHLDETAQSLGLTHLKPKNDNRNLKLDHIYVRGLELVDIEVLTQYQSSDHYPVRATFKKSAEGLLAEAI